MTRVYLVVEDVPVMFDVVRDAVISVDPSATIHWVQSIALAVAHLEQHAVSVDVLLLDNGLPDGHGIDWLPEARARLGPRPLVAICTAAYSTELAAATADAGGDAFIVKNDAPSMHWPLLQLLELERHGS